MRALYRQAMVSGAAVVGFLAILEGPGVVTRWRADLTARRLARAMHQVDSIAMANLSASGSSKNLLCARRHWPTAFWSHKGREPEVVRSDSIGETFSTAYSARSSPKSVREPRLNFWSGADIRTRWLVTPWIPLSCRN
jgi:hypothetical protein